MILACVAIPLLLAIAGRWLPSIGVVAPIGAGLTLAACLTLPWTGAAIGPLLAPDPLGVHVAILAAFAWFASTLLEPDDHATAAVTGFVTLALLASSPDVTVLAAGAAAMIAALALRQRLEVAAAAGLGVAVFGMALLHAAVGNGVDWAGMAEAARQARGAVVGSGSVLTLLGLGCVCMLLPLWAVLRRGVLPHGLAMLCLPLGGVWLVVALRLRGVLDGNGHAIAPGGWLVAAGLLLMLLAVLCAWTNPARLVPGAVLSVLGGAVLGMGGGGTVGTGSGLLHLTIGCLAMVCAGVGGWAGLLGVAALAGIPPIGVFASGYGVFAAALATNPPVAVAFALLAMGMAAAALRQMPIVSLQASPPIGWASAVLVLGASWMLPQFIAAWLSGIAAAAR